jgi:hypothetical protein
LKESTFADLLLVLMWLALTCYSSLMAFLKNQKLLSIDSVSYSSDYCFPSLFGAVPVDALRWRNVGFVHKFVVLLLDLRPIVRAPSLAENPQGKYIQPSSFLFPVPSVPRKRLGNADSISTRNLSLFLKNRSAQQLYKFDQLDR